MTDRELPAYDDLPAGEVGGRLGWGIWGEQDEIGLGRLLTPERVRAAAGLIRTGRVFPLSLPIGAIDPPLNPRRSAAAHRVIAQPNIGFDDAWDDLYPQAGSQWDSLGHIGYTRQHFYNGATAEEVQAGRRNAISAWAAHGIAGRGVVIDVEPVLQGRLGEYDPLSTVEITIADLETAQAKQGVEIRPGDILLLATGFTRRYLEVGPDQRRAMSGGVTAPGLEHSEDICRYLWNLQVAAVASDTFAVEAWPANTDESAQPFGFIHQILIGSFGMALGELWWLADLVHACRATGVWEGLLVSAPWEAHAAISSPANAVFLA